MHIASLDFSCIIVLPRIVWRKRSNRVGGRLFVDLLHEHLCRPDITADKGRHSDIIIIIVIFSVTLSLLYLITLSIILIIIIYLLISY